MNEKVRPKLSYMVSHLVWFSNPNLAANLLSLLKKKTKMKQIRIAREVLLLWPNTVAATTTSSYACSRRRVLARCYSRRWITFFSNCLFCSCIDFRNFLSSQSLTFFLSKQTDYIYRGTFKWEDFKMRKWEGWISAIGLNKWLRLNFNFKHQHPRDDPLFLLFPWHI
jgi:hypothetical protein